MLRRLCVIPLIVSLLVLTAGHPAGAQPPAEPARPAPIPVDSPTRDLAVAVGQTFGRIAVLEAHRLWNAELERQAAERAAARRPPQQPRRAAASYEVPGTGGHDPCAESIADLLPGYIIQRESRGDCHAYNHGGCGGRGCLGPAQIDEGHFYANSPWSDGPGTCYGLTYRGCVIRLKERGGLTPWRCC